MKEQVCFAMPVCKLCGLFYLALGGLQKVTPAMELTSDGVSDSEWARNLLVQNPLEFGAPFQEGSFLAVM